MAGATAGAELSCKTRTVVVEVKNWNYHWIASSTTQMKMNIRRMCGIEESSRRTGFADFAIKVFNIVQERQACTTP